MALGNLFHFCLSNLCFISIFGLKPVDSYRLYWSVSWLFFLLFRFVGLIFCRCCCFFSFTIFLKLFTFYLVAIGVLGFFTILWNYSCFNFPHQWPELQLLVSKVQTFTYMLFYCRMYGKLSRQYLIKVWQENIFRLTRLVLFFKNHFPDHVPHCSVDNTILLAVLFRACFFSFPTGKLKNK